MKIFKIFFEKFSLAFLIDLKQFRDFSEPGKGSRGGFSEEVDLDQNPEKGPNRVFEGSGFRRCLLRLT